MLSDELAWRGLSNQTTFKDAAALNIKEGQGPLTFYWGVDPSADSMTVGNLAPAMMVRHFMEHGHKAVLLVGGATGLIGDPDGKKEERDLKTIGEIEANKRAIVAQYQRIFDGMDFTIVDNYDWFKDMNYLAFLRDVGKHVPMRQMLGRDFVQSRLGEDGAGISYAEFSYSLIQGYDFLQLHREYGVGLQLCGADQWGNCIAGVDLVRRVTGDEVHVWSMPLVVNKVTGVKFGKSESGAVWLDAAKTSPTQFYQFWINADDESVQDYLGIYTLLSKQQVEDVMQQHQLKPQERLAQRTLADAVTGLVHGTAAMQDAQMLTHILTGKVALDEATESTLAVMRQEQPAYVSGADASIVTALTETGLAGSATEARRLLADGAISINGMKITADRGEHFLADDFNKGRLLLRKGKKFRDTALIETDSPS